MYQLLRRGTALLCFAATLAIGSCLDGGRVCTVPTPDGETWTTERRSNECARLYEVLDNLKARDAGDIIID